MTAEPYEGSEFVSWRGDVLEGEEKEDTINVTMTESKKITAIFEEEEDGNGSDGETPGFITTLLLLSSIIAAVIYRVQKG